MSSKDNNWLKGADGDQAQILPFIPSELDIAYKRGYIDGYNTGQCEERYSNRKAGDETPVKEVTESK